jgi:hypothetical protein
VKGAPRWKVEEMLPPGAADLDAPLPQAPIRSNVPLPIPKHVPDSLLPPGVGEDVPSGALQQVALPEAEMERQWREMNRPAPPTNVPKDAVLIPTEEGSYVALREPVKTVGKGVNERELHVLPPEVKQKRRALRTIIVYVVGLIVLVVSFILLTKV